MAGITNSPFRRLMRRYDSALVISELVSAKGIQYGSQKTLELLRFTDQERPVGLQVFGEEIDSLCYSCRVIEKLGADFIDLNLGCPVSKVVKKGAGAAMCRDPILLGKILKKIVSSVSIPITIKIRTGWDQGSRNTFSIIQAAIDANVAWVAIHGRTRAQGYEGLADWDWIGEMKIKSKNFIPILGNGDVTTPELALKYLKQYEVDGILIGRGALRNPFIFRQAHSLWKNEEYFKQNKLDFIQLIKEMKELFEESFSPTLAALYARKLLSWYASGFSGCHEFRKQLFSQQQESDFFWNLAFDFFENNGRDRDLKFLEEGFLMGGHG